MNKEKSKSGKRPSIESLILEATRRQLIYEQHKPDKADPATVSIIANIPFKALSIREVLYHRFVDLNGTAIDLINDKKWVAAFVLIRCSIESLALLHQMEREIDECIKTGVIEKADSFLVKALLGRSGKDSETFPVNIMAAITGLNSKHDKFKEAYEELSGYVHPNVDGLLSAYARWDKDEMYLYLGPQEQKRSHGVGLSILLMTMSAFELVYNRLPPKLMQFSSICETRVKAKKTEIGEHSTGLPERSPNPKQ